MFEPVAASGVKDHKIGKYLLRLKHASLREVFYRFTQAVDNRRLEYKPFRCDIPSNEQAAALENVARLILPTVHFAQPAGYVDEAISPARCLNGGKQAIADFERKYRARFSGNVPHYDLDVDIRQVWEPARLQHVTHALFTLDDKAETDRLVAEESVKAELLGWIEDNLLLRGPHYHSVMECGLRVPVFFSCLKLLGNLNQREERRILGAMHEHAWLIARRLSLFSSLGNHTICEAVGLVFSGAVFQESTAGLRWFERGVALLRQEVEHQVLSDGGPAEQSFVYHRFVLDLYWFTVDFLELNDLAECSAVVPLLTAGENFLAAFEDGCGHYIPIGDSDDGCAIAPGVRPGRRSTTRKNVQGQIISNVPTTFEKAGYTVIGNDNGFRLIFDHGPLGMAPLYNHGHADALSVLLSVKGRPILSDPGTYRYNGAGEWRRYFKSTRAHNTVTIDDEDQAVQQTGFIWSNPYSVTLDHCLTFADGCFLQATHHGYARLQDPVVHTRSLLWLNSGVLVIKDVFSGNKNHVFELNLHFHPDTELTLQRSKGAGWLAQCDGDSLHIFSKSGLQLVRGQERPILGWYSREYGQKEPCSVLTGRASGRTGKIDFFTVISPETRNGIGLYSERIKSIEETLHS